MFSDYPGFRDLFSYFIYSSPHKTKSDLMWSYFYQLFRILYTSWFTLDSPLIHPWFTFHPCLKLTYSDVICCISTEGHKSQWMDSNQLWRVYGVSILDKDLRKYCKITSIQQEREPELSGTLNTYFYSDRIQSVRFVMPCAVCKQWLYYYFNSVLKVGLPCWV